MKNNPFIIEGAIASEVKIKEKNVSHTVIKEDSEILSYPIGDRYFLSLVEGSSMTHKKIFDNDMVLFDSKFTDKDLKKDQVLLIKMSEDVELNAGKYKLRIFEDLDTNSTVKVYKYKDGKKVFSKGKHYMHNVYGVEEKVIGSSLTKKFLDEYSETIEVKILEHNNAYCAKFSNIEYFVGKIEEFASLLEEQKRSVINYIIDTTLEYGDTKEYAKNNFKSHFQEGLSVFKHLKNNKEIIDQLSIIYFKFLELANNQIKFS